MMATSHQLPLRLLLALIWLGTAAPPCWAVSIANIETISSELTTPDRVPAGGAFGLTCRATGPDGLALRLACPLAAATAASACFEDCRRPLCAGPAAEARCRSEAPKLLDAGCSLQRRRLATGADLWEVTASYWFADVGPEHAGNYTCQFKQMSAVSSVQVLTAVGGITSAPPPPQPPPPPPPKTTTSPGTVATTRSVVGEAVIDDGGSDRPVSDAAPVVTTAAVRSEPTAEPSPGDWFRIELYGPITMGHVIVAALVSAIVLITACLTAGLVCCYCRRRSRKRKLQGMMAERGGSWASMRYRQQPVGSPADPVICIAGGAGGGIGDASWATAQTYAEVESPLISGGGGRPGIGSGSNGNGVRAFGGSQGAGLNGVGAIGGFFSREQQGRHSFHSIRQQATRQRVATQQQQQQHPQQQQDGPLPESIVALVAEQRAEIERLSQQLRSSQQQLNRLAASNTDLHRCLSSASSRLRHASSSPRNSPTIELSGARAAAAAAAADSDAADDAAAEHLMHCRIGIGSMDALTVETIDEEYEADGTLRAPARQRDSRA